MTPSSTDSSFLGTKQEIDPKEKQIRVIQAGKSKTASLAGMHKKARKQFGRFTDIV